MSKYPEEYTAEFVKSANWLLSNAHATLAELDKAESASPIKSTKAAEIVGYAQAISIMAQISESPEVFTIATSAFAIAATANIRAAEDCVHYDAFEDANAHLQIATEMTKLAHDARDHANEDEEPDGFLGFLKKMMQEEHECDGNCEECHEHD